MVFIDVRPADHYYSIYVRVPKQVECPHGTGDTIRVGDGIRIKCPEDQDCWLIKIEEE